LANIKSQIKRNRQNTKRRLRNRAFRGAARAAVLGARAAIDSGAGEPRQAVLRAISLLDKAAERGVLHPNNAARRKGRLMKRLAQLAASPAAATVTPGADKAAAGEAPTPQAPAGRRPARKAPAKKTSRKTAS
jgi:small subunit ribosomal protein S20